jgi:hypothetical protein
MFPTLSKTYAAIEDRIDHKVDHWGNIFAWSMFQACHSHARSLLEQGVTEIAILEVPLGIIDRYVVFNLSEEGWAEERAQYSALGSDTTHQGIHEKEAAP